MLLYIVIKMLTALAYLAEQTFTSFNMYSVYTETKGIHQRERERERFIVVTFITYLFDSTCSPSMLLALQYTSLP